MNEYEFSSLFSKVINDANKSDFRGLLKYGLLEHSSIQNENIFYSFLKLSTRHGSSFVFNALVSEFLNNENFHTNIDFVNEFIHFLSTKIKSFDKHLNANQILTEVISVSVLNSRSLSKIAELQREELIVATLENKNLSPNDALTLLKFYHFGDIKFSKGLVGFYNTYKNAHPFHPDLFNEFQEKLFELTNSPEFLPDETKNAFLF